MVLLAKPNWPLPANYVLLDYSAQLTAPRIGTTGTRQLGGDERFGHVKKSRYTIKQFYICFRPEHLYIHQLTLSHRLWPFHQFFLSQTLPFRGKWRQTSRQMKEDDVNIKECKGLKTIIPPSAFCTANLVRLTTLSGSVKANQSFFPLFFQLISITTYKHSYCSFSNTNGTNLQKDEVP